MDAIVKFDYEKQQDDEISLRTGEILVNVRQVDEGWWEGTLNGVIGMFPDNFVDLKPAGSLNKPSVAPAASRGPAPVPVMEAAVNKRERRAKVAFSYIAGGDDELTLNPGQIVVVLDEVEEGWWKGRLDGKEGVFPCNFVEEIEDEAPWPETKPTTTTSMTQPKTQKPQADNSCRSAPMVNVMLGRIGVDANELRQSVSTPTTTNEPKHQILKLLQPSRPPLPTIVKSAPQPLPPSSSSSGLKKAKVIFLYYAMNPDEVSVKEGDIVEVLQFEDETEQEGWWMVKCANGRQGLVPDNFVELIPPLSAVKKYTPPPAQPLPPSSPSSGLKKAKVIFLYDAENPDEISVKEGDIVEVLQFEDETEQEGWWMVKCANGRQGLVPDNFVELIPPLPAVKKSTPPPAQPLPPSSPSSGLKKAKVIFLYDAMNPDEVSVKEGDIVEVLQFEDETEQEGWWMVKCADGRQGLVPDNFVELMQSAPVSDFVDADATKEAIKQEVEVSISKLMVSGSPGSGKTCVVNLSVGEPAPGVRNSTGCVETPVRAIAQSTICINGTKLQKLETEQMLYKVCQAMRHRVDEIKNEEFVKKTHHHKVRSIYVTPLSPLQLSTDSSPSMGDYIPMSTEASSSANAEDREETNLQVFSKLLAKISSAEASTDFLTAHLVLTIDSGGQPHFMDVAPLFLRNNSLFLLTMKLNERLDSKPRFSYFINGQPIEMSDTELQPTNLQLIELLAKSISSLQLSTSTSTPSVKSESRHAKFMIVGTFADKAEDCQDESVADKNSILRDQLKDYEAERIDAGNDVIFAVNAITTDPDERRKAALRLQDKITNTPGMTIKTRIKLRWFGLLLHLLDEAEKKGVSIIPLEDVLAVGRCLQMNSSETLQAIAFFHELNLLMYFSTDKLGNIVFIDVKPILGKVSNLIGISFIDKDKLNEIFSPNLPVDAQRLLRDYGRFSREILDSSFHFSAPLTTDVFLDLLEHLCVIARIEKDSQTSFFLPCALPHAPEDILQEKEKISSNPWMIMLQTRRGATLVDVPIPKSYLPTLAVHLLNSPDFEVDLKTHQYRNLLSIHYRGSRVYLIERNLQLEIYYPCADDDEEMSKDCSLIRSAIQNALVVVEEKLHFVPNILIKNDAFLCSCDGSCHICVYNKDRKRTSCDKSDKLRKLNQQQQYWLQQQQQQPAAPVAMQPTTELPPSVVPTSGAAAPILPSGAAAPILPSADPLNKPPKTRELLRKVASRATDKWELIGLDLEIEQHQLNTISQSHPRNTIRCYSEVFSLWQRKADPPFTWATIIDVLHSPVVEENALAQEIEDWLRTSAT